MDKPILPFRGICQIFHGYAVSLFPVFFCKDKDFIIVRIIKRTAIGNDMIHFRIRWIFQELLHIEMFLGICAFSILLFAKLKFHDIHTLGTKYTKFAYQTLSDLFIFCLIFLHSFFHFLTIPETSCQFAGQFDMDFHRISIPEDNGIDDFQRLTDGSFHHRIRYIIDIFQRAFSEIITCPFAGSGINFSFFKKRKNFVASLEGKMSELAETGKSFQKCFSIRFFNSPFF